MSFQHKSTTLLPASFFSLFSPFLSLRFLHLKITSSSQSNSTSYFLSSRKASFQLWSDLGRVGQGGPCGVVCSLVTVVSPQNTLK